MALDPPKKFSPLPSPPGFWEAWVEGTMGPVPVPTTNGTHFLFPTPTGGQFPTAGPTACIYSDQNDTFGNEATSEGLYPTLYCNTTVPTGETAIPIICLENLHNSEIHDEC